MNPHVKRILYFTLGLASLIIATLAGAIPGLPGFPFLVIALWAFAQSNKRFRDWLLRQRIVQRTLREGHNFVAHKSLTRAAKLTIFFLSWILFLGAFMLGHNQLDLRAKLFGLAALVCTLVVLLLPTQKKEPS